MSRTLTFAGAKGGQGTTTVASATAVLAAGHLPTTLVTDDLVHTAALLGLPRPTGTAAIHVSSNLWLATQAVDGTAITVVDGDAAGLDGAERYTVVRGPCYLALAAVLERPGPPPDGIVLLDEKGRSLTARDVTEVTGIPVVATVVVSEVVARAIDAGLLLARMHRLTDLQALRTLAAPPSSTPSHRSTPTSSRRSAAPSCQTLTTRSTNGTDLPRSASGPRGDLGTRVKSRRERHPSMHVDGLWKRDQQTTRAEHRQARARRRRLLHR